MHEGSEDPETITLTRAIINIPSVIGDQRKPNDQWDILIDKDKKIGYIRITGFNEHTADELQKMLEQFKDDGGKALILDLRDDPGGLLSAAVEVSDMFLDKGEIVSTKGRNTQPRHFEAQKDSPFESSDMPMVVMVNQNSASASEIVAAALQDHKRAAVVGQRSYGKGSVQNLIDLDGGNSILKLTVASYYRPSGENIHRFKNAKTTDKWGVSPDPGWRSSSTIATSSTGSSPGANATVAPLPRAIARPARTRQSCRRRPRTRRLRKNQPRRPGTERQRRKRRPRRISSQRRTPSGPFVDKQLDRALEVIRADWPKSKPRTPSESGCGRLPSPIP